MVRYCLLASSQTDIMFLPFHQNAFSMHMFIISVFSGKFVSVKGTVVRVSNIKPLCTVLAFECNNCGTVQVTYINTVFLLRLNS